MVYALNSEALFRQMEAYRHKLDPCPECGGQVTCSFRIPNHMTKNPKNLFPFTKFNMSSPVIEVFCRKTVSFSNV